jgi:two-component system, OmpR family, response regulator
MPRVLVVDDDADVLSLLEEVFQSRAWKVTGAGSAARARERLDATRYDLVVIDLTMPGEGGLSLAEHAAARGLAVLVISGDTLKLSTMAPLRFRVLQKPFRIDDFMRTVEESLNTIRGSAL